MSCNGYGKPLRLRCPCSEGRFGDRQCLSGLGTGKPSGVPLAFYADGPQGDAANLMGRPVEEIVGLLASEGRRIGAEAFTRQVEHSDLCAWGVCRTMVHVPLHFHENVTCRTIMTLSLVTTFEISAIGIMHARDATWQLFCILARSCLRGWARIQI